MYFSCTRFDSSTFSQFPHSMKLLMQEFFLFVCIFLDNSFPQIWHAIKRHCKHSHRFVSSLVFGNCFQCRLSIEAVHILRLHAVAPFSPALRHTRHVLHSFRVHGGLQQFLHNVLRCEFCLWFHMDAEYSSRAHVFSHRSQ